MTGEITEYLSSLIGQTLIYGENDCHIMALTIYDIKKCTNEADQLKGKYSTAIAGRKYAKKNCTHPTLEAFLKEHCTEEEIPHDGDILLSDDHCTVFWRNKVILICEGKYTVQEYQNNNYKIYRIVK